MKKLIINTANSELLIVLDIDNQYFFAKNESPKHHNEVVLSLIDELLTKHNLTIQNIDEFGVVVGPGSFTGIRVGISLIKAFRDSTGKPAKGINNLDLLFKLASRQNKEIETVAIEGSRDSYFVAKLINEIIYKYERNLTLNELLEVADGKQIGSYTPNENFDAFVVDEDLSCVVECFDESTDIDLVPVYYQLSQAENEKLRRGDVEIDDCFDDDLEVVANIEKNSIISNPMSIDVLKSRLNNENYKIFVAKLDSEVVGFVVLQITDEVNIDSIAVDKRFRNLGIGTKLLKHCEGVASGLSKPLSLEVSDKNITAYLLYKKFGFVERVRRKSYYDDGSDAIEMIKSYL